MWLRGVPTLRAVYILGNLGWDSLSGPSIRVQEEEKQAEFFNISNTGLFRFRHPGLFVMLKAMLQFHDHLSHSKRWFLFGGLLSVLVGVFAIAAPCFFSFVLTQLFGVLCLATGVVALFQALMGKNSHHRLFSALSAIIRIAAGSVLLFFPVAGMAALTLILAVVFLSEGIVCIVTSFRLRTNPAWIWLLLNGLVALLLGGMIYAKWPMDSTGIIGLLYGIQSLFSGAAMLLMGFSAKPPVSA